MWILNWLLVVSLFDSLEFGFFCELNVLVIVCGVLLVGWVWLVFWCFLFFFFGVWSGGEFGIELSWWVFVVFFLFGDGRGFYYFVFLVVKFIWFWVLGIVKEGGVDFYIKVEIKLEWGCGCGICFLGCYLVLSGFLIWCIVWWVVVF